MAYLVVFMLHIPSGRFVEDTGATSLPHLLELAVFVRYVVHRLARRTPLGLLNLLVMSDDCLHQVVLRAQVQFVDGLQRLNFRLVFRLKRVSRLLALKH